MGIWEIQVCFSGKMQDLRGSCLQLCHWVEDHWTSQVVPGLCTTELTHTTCRRKKKNRWPQQLSRYVHIIFSGGSSKIMTLNMCPGKGVLLPHQDSQTSMLTWSHTLLLQLSHHIICHVNFLSSAVFFIGVIHSRFINVKLPVIFSSSTPNLWPKLFVPFVYLFYSKATTSTVFLETHNRKVWLFFQKRKRGENIYFFSLKTQTLSSFLFKKTTC